jgi:hypothetical protein
MRIGELAALTGCTPKALRLYEAHGLLGTVARRGNYRNYDPEDVQRVQWIRQALSLGFAWLRYSRYAASTPLRRCCRPGAAPDPATRHCRRTGAAASCRHRPGCIDHGTEHMRRCKDMPFTRATLHLTL